MVGWAGRVYQPVAHGLLKFTLFPRASLAAAVPWDGNDAGFPNCCPLGYELHCIARARLCIPKACGGAKNGAASESGAGWPGSPTVAS